MMQGVQEMVKTKALSESSTFRVPCIVHVIQLSLKDLLGKLKANPVNEETESEWLSKCPKPLQLTLKQSSKDIMARLKKVSFFYYYIFF
jgi:hypothetical protein